MRIDRQSSEEVEVERKGGREKSRRDIPNPYKRERCQSLLQRIGYEGTYSGSDISGDHDRRSTGFEFGENPISFLLLLVSVNRECRPSILTEVLGELVRDSFRSDEDEDFGGFGGDLFEVFDEPAQNESVTALRMTENDKTHFPRFS